MNNKAVHHLSDHATGAPETTWPRFLAASLACASLCLVWLIVLPWLGQQPPVKAHVEALHAAEINASAMFYSELECQQWLRK